MKKIISILCFSLLSANIFSQDTLTVMSYNLLNYPGTTPTRYNDLKVIIQYCKPDIFICSELQDATGADLILNNSFNAAPVNYYARANFMDGNDTDNMLFYNTNKVTLASQNQITTALRDISHYHFYTCEGTDTVWYDIFSMHLKASSGITNANDRQAECAQLTNYIATLPTNTNIIVGGDFNFYSILPSIEPAWNQLTVTCSQPLKDPLNMAGEWHSNTFYKNIHTQATRSAANPGCCGGSTGGMDDRFDFLLINQNLRDGLEGAKYMPGTYKAVGQDGNHFNQALVEGASNSSVPAAVNTALFNMSDHLPVFMKIYTCDVTIGLDENSEAGHLKVSFGNDNNLFVNADYLKVENITAEIITLNGSIVLAKEFRSSIGHNQFTLPLPIMEKGMYVLRLISPSGTLVTKFTR
jgi:hypothetical protein